MEARASCTGGLLVLGTGLAAESDTDGVGGADGRMGALTAEGSASAGPLLQPTSSDHESHARTGRAPERMTAEVRHALHRRELT